MAQILRGLIWLVFAGLSAAPVGAQQASTSDGEPLNTIEGIVVAARAWAVSPKVSNLIHRLHFTEGIRVKEGDLLVEMDSGLKQLEVDLATADRDQAKVSLAMAEDDLARQEKLKAREAVSVKSYQNAFFVVESAKVELKTAELKLDIATEILKSQRIFSPFDGRITEPLYHENAYVDLTQGTEIATVVQLDPINVRASISVKRMLTRLRAGEFGRDFAKQIRMELRLSDGLVYPHFGKIISTGVGVDSKTGNGTILVSFPNPDGLLRPGLPVLLTGHRK